MESQGRELLLAKEVDKGEMPLFQGGSSVGSLLKNLHLGKVTSQDQQESKSTNPLGEHFESKYLVNGSEPFHASILQASQTYTSKGIKLVFHDTCLDVDSSNVLTKVLECCKIFSGKVNELEYNALETLIFRCLNRDGRGSTPWTLILSIEPAAVHGITCYQSLEKVKLTEQIIIVQVPLANPYTFTEEVAKEITERFQLHYSEGIRVVYLLGKRFFVTTINGEKPITEPPGEMIGEQQLQLKITELVGGYFKSKEDLVNASDKRHVLSSSCEGAKKHFLAGNECSGQGKASTSSSERDKELIQGGKTLPSDVQKQEVPKRKKY